MAQQHTPEAIERLVFWLRSENARASVAAALAIIERGYGRPVQPLDVTHRPAPDLTQLTDAELATLETLLAKAERDPGAVH
jgi:hypothetical protein